MAMEIDQTGEDFIKQYENLSLVAYKPLPTDKWTIGFGSTTGVYEGMEITEDEAEHRFQTDIFYPQKTVNSLVTTQLTQNQFNALVALVFNIGSQSFHNSKALTYLNQGDYDNFYNEAFSRENGFCHSGGQFIEGLYNRRQAEFALFQS